MNEKSVSTTRISMHSVKNLLGNQSQASLFSDHDKQFADEFSIDLRNSIDRFGIDLTDIQLKVMEGILMGFSETQYKGNLNPKQSEELANEKYSGKLPNTYKYIREIPRLRATQAQILDWSGINKNSIASKTRALEAIRDLGTVQFCFYYDRLAFSESGVPEKDKDGKWKKEQVVAVDTLFTIKKVMESNSEVLSYYEITPSSIFLDQIEGYFILIPFRWREEVRKIFGNKKASAYTFRFLLFLRYQYELKRRSSGQSGPAQLKWSPEEVAIALKMPESIYIRKKARMNEILEDAYSVAKQLGYLADYQRKGFLDVLTFNEKKYSLNSSLPQIEDLHQNKLNSDLNCVASSLLEFFIKCRKELDSNYDIASQEERTASLNEFSSLIKERKEEDIKSLIQWSAAQRYWATRLSSPKKLKLHFSEAWIEYNLSKKLSKEEIAQKNKQLAWGRLKKLHEKSNTASSVKDGSSQLFLLNSSVEITLGPHCTAIEYKDPEFVEKLRNALKKYRFEGIDI